jgi:hypothetical protein
MYEKKEGENNLENKVKDNYRSDGERKIAGLLDQYKIKYVYEKPTLVQDNGSKLRLWYPDFTLPEFDILIEYYGMANGGNDDYDKGVKRKQDVYLNGHNKAISVYRSTFNGNWQQYILGGIQNILQKRSTCFEGKLTGSGYVGKGNNSKKY